MNQNEDEMRVDPLAIRPVRFNNADQEQKSLDNTKYTETVCILV